MEGFKDKFSEDVQHIAYKTGLKKWQVIFALLGKVFLIIRFGKRFFLTTTSSKNGLLTSRHI